MTSIAEASTPSGRLYAGGGRTLYQSEDCAASWQPILRYPLPGRAAALVTAAASDSIGRIYVMPAGFQVKTLHMSTDGGVTWSAIQDGDRWIAVPQGGLFVTPSGRIYVRSASMQGVLNAEGFGYSDDGGESWNVAWGSNGPSSFTVDPKDADIIYAIDKFTYQPSPSQATPGIPTERLPHPPPYQLVRSLDRGRTFEQWSTVDELPGGLAVSADGIRFWFASYGQHLWQSRDSGQSWQVMDTMPFTDPKQLAVSPHDPRILYAVSGDGNIWVYREPDPGT